MSTTVLHDSNLSFTFLQFQILLEFIWNDNFSEIFLSENVCVSNV